MRPSEYHAPSTVEEAVRVLHSDGPPALALGGGTDLLVHLRDPTRQASRIVDLKKIPELSAIELVDGGLRIGAAVPCARLAADPSVRGPFPGLAEAIGLIGSTQIQNRATLAGNLCNASPAADTVPPLLVLGAVAELAGHAGTRDIPIAEFIQAPARTVLRPGEIVTAIRVPAPPAGSADAYLRFIPRNEMDIAVVGVAARVVLDGGVCVRAQIALGAVGPRAFLADAAAAALIGTTIDAGALARCADAAAGAATPIDDARGTVAFRRDVTATLTRRAVVIAHQRAAAAPPPA